MRTAPALIAPALIVLTLMASCVAPPAPRLPALTPRAPVARSTALALPTALPVDWRDWPLTPGDWRYERVTDGTIATFRSSSAPAVAVQCDMRGRRVHLTWYVATGGQATVRTSTLSRMLSFSVDGDPPGSSVTAILAASDPLLDAIAFSRGRWTIEQPGAAPLILPAYAEVARVIEDCRA